MLIRKYLPNPPFPVECRENTFECRGVMPPDWASSRCLVPPQFETRDSKEVVFINGGNDTYLHHKVCPTLYEMRLVGSGKYRFKAA